MNGKKNPICGHEQGCKSNAYRALFEQRNFSKLSSAAKIDITTGSAVLEIQATC